jgi:cystathionine gamma-lyase
MTQVAGAWGLEVTYLDMEGAGENVIRDAIRPNTKLIWVESPTNPTLRLMDIPLLAHIAHTHPSSPYLLVDNTFLSPFYSSPLLQGADVVIHSLTKYINGHSDVIMGCAILPAHNSALHAKLRFLQNAIGAVPSPHDCYLAQRGAKTLAMRMKTHGRNALRVARALEASPYVQEVIYPGLKGHRGHGLAYRSLAPHAKRWVDAFVGGRNISRGDDWEDDGEGLDGLHDTPHLNGTYTPESEEEDDNDDNSVGDFPYGGMISVRLKPFPPSHSLPHSPTTPSPSPSPPPAQSPALALLPILRLFTLAESLGGVESLAELPSAMTHAGVPESERALLGIDDNLIRLSVGCEEGQDLVEDLVSALGRVYAGVAV